MSVPFDDLLEGLDDPLCDKRLLLDVTSFPGMNHHSTRSTMSVPFDVLLEGPDYYDYYYYYYYFFYYYYYCYEHSNIFQS